MSDPNDIRRQVQRQNNAWLLQIAGIFIGGLVGVLFGVYVLMAVFGSTGLILTLGSMFIGAWIGGSMAQNAVLR